MGLDMAMTCKDLGVLPGPGGIFDQDIVYMRWLQAGLQALRKVEAKQAERQQSRSKRRP